nr:helix-turn-helix transcriptional regulator [Allosalinactinospora lopnorensis]
MRNLTDISQRRLASATHVSPQQVGAIERAERYPGKDFAELADNVLGGDGALIELWRRLYNASYPAWLSELVEVEPLATMVREYHPTLVPGLLQTKDYAWATVRAGNPLMRDEEVERLVAARMNRQRLLSKPDAPITVTVVDETVVTRPLGSPEVMHAQLSALLDKIDQRRIQLQIVPFTTRQHPGLTGPFTVLSFPDKPDLVYVEDVVGGTMVQKPDQVSRMTVLFGSLQGVALSPDESVKLLRETQEEFGGTQVA